MQETTKTVKSAGLSGAMAATLLLGFYCAPALSAIGVDCDRATSRPASLEIAKPDLTVAVADHGVIATKSVTAQEGPTDSRRPIADPRAMAPKADTILRRIFDESYSLSELDELEPASATDAKSIAELALPSQPGDPVEDTGDGDLPALDADLPGISDDETLRYRREMFRTDI